MESESSIPHQQKPATGIHSESTESNPHRPNLFFKDILIQAFHLRLGLNLRFTTNILYAWELRFSGVLSGD